MSKNTLPLVCALALAIAAGGVLAQPASAPRDDAALDGFKALHASVLRGRQEARDSLAAAHAALDEGKYQLAEQLHRKAVAAQQAAEASDAKLQKELDAYIGGFLKGLDAESHRDRERATEQLRRLGPYAAAAIERAATAASGEVQVRLRDVLKGLATGETDPLGRLRQWASKAEASSQYGPDDWCAGQATGKPDTHQDGDQKTAWASQEADGGEEWLELTYDRPVRPELIRIHETYNPGAVVKVEAKDGDGKWQVLWEGKDPCKLSPSWLELTGRAPAFATRSIRITIDSAGVPGWNEIDAVELIGYEPLAIRAATRPASTAPAAWKATAVPDANAKEPPAQPEERAAVSAPGAAQG